MHILYTVYKSSMFKGYICIRDSLPEKYSNKKSSSVVHLKVIIMSLLYVHVLFVEKKSLCNEFETI